MFSRFFDIDIILARLYLLPWILLALSFHEFCHGYVSSRLGDPTPEHEGRLSLNPLAHLDPVGFLAMFFFGFGWAKPVQVNPGYYRNPMKGMLWVALAGPVANFILAVILGLLIRFAFLIGFSQQLDHFLDIFGLQSFSFISYLYLGIQITISLGLFNLIPIPPLDGSKILRYFLKGQWIIFFDQIERFGMFILLIGLFSGFFDYLLRFAYLLTYFLTGLLP